METDGEDASDDYEPDYVAEEQKSTLVPVQPLQTASVEELELVKVLTPTSVATEEVLSEIECPA